MESKFVMYSQIAIPVYFCISKDIELLEQKKIFGTETSPTRFMERY